MIHWYQKWAHLPVYTKFVLQQFRNWYLKTNLRYQYFSTNAELTTTSLTCPKLNSVIRCHCHFNFFLLFTQYVMAKKVVKDFFLDYINSTTCPWCGKSNIISLSFLKAGSLFLQFFRLQHLPSVSSKCLGFVLAFFSNVYLKLVSHCSIFSCFTMNENIQVYFIHAFGRIFVIAEFLLNGIS